MRLVYLGVALITILTMWPASTQADGCHVMTSPPTYTAGNTVPQDSCDAKSNKYVTLGTLLSGEDPSATGGGSSTGVIVTEGRYLVSATVTSDTLIKTGAGYVKDVNCVGTDATATAGSIKIEDATTATTPVIFTYTVPAVALVSPVLTFPLEVVMTTGIFIDFTTTADVACYVRYR